MPLSFYLYAFEMFHNKKYSMFLFSTSLHFRCSHHDLSNYHRLLPGLL